MVYKLQLLSQSTIHSVLQVATLKINLGQHTSPDPALPSTNAQGQFILEPIAILEGKMIQQHNKPVAILARKINKRDNKLIPQVLIQWFDLPL